MILPQLKSAIEFCLDLIFPKRCISCARYGNILCSDCRAKIKMIKTFVCPKCGRITKSGQFCPSCKGKNPLTGLLVAADYEKGPTKELIHYFKYNGIMEIGPILAGILISRLKKSPLRGRQVLIPVPLHPKRQRIRGFNQAEVLARAVGKKLPIPVKLVLARKKSTKSQVELSGWERRRNILGMFKCLDNKEVERKTVILVDDVSTTGATLEECAKVLRENGARQVWGLVVARG